MDAAKLKSLFQRINNVLDERDALMGDVRDLYEEAKAGGYIPKVLRRIITRHRAKDQAALQKEDSLLEDYMALLDSKTKAVLSEIRAGTTFDATAEKTGVPRRTVARLAEAVPERKETGTADAPDTATDDMLAAAAHFESLKRERGFAT